MRVEPHPEVPASVIESPVAADRLTTLRDATTGHTAFRRALVDLGRTAGHAVADAVGTDPVTVETPLATAEGARLGDDGVVLVAVLRAAVPFVEGIQSVLPRASQGVVSASRDESARRPDGRFPVAVEYANVPDTDGRTVVVADPMLATGSTATAVLDAIGGDPDRTIVLAAVSAPAGVERVADAGAGAEVLTVAVDDRLDEDGYIVPVLGDAGDRAFGTESS
ncbi:MAG: uracil phosphoribosyltransferase [Halobacteriaceae archaeon]